MVAGVEYTGRRIMWKLDVPVFIQLAALLSTTKDMAARVHCGGPHFHTGLEWVPRHEAIIHSRYR